jgi:hypothetical protein
VHPFIKKIIIYFLFAVLLFAAGFFSRSVFDRSRVSGTAEYYQNIQSELQRADESHNRLEENINGARNGITASIELSGDIGDGLVGIESLAAENTELLGRAERILLDAGAREHRTQE